MSLNTETIARASSRHPWRTITVWVVLLMAAGYASGQMLDDVLTNDFAFTNRPESVQAHDLLEDRLTGPEKDTELVLVEADSLTIEDPAFEAEVRKVQTELSGLGKGVVAAPIMTVYDLPEEQGAALVSNDNRATLIPVEISDTESETVDALRGAVERSEAEGFTLSIAGTAVLNDEFTKIGQEEAAKGEAIGVPVALIVLIVVFGALLAAILPIVMAIFSIMLSLAAVALIGQLFHFQVFVTNMISMIGLAVGIDYSLFVVSRYREERRRGREKLEAIGHAGGTANRAVFFSGMMVVIALCGMLIVPQTIFKALAGGAILVVIAALATSMTLLPALLAVLGDKINWPRFSKRAKGSDPEPRGGFWDRVTGVVMKHPVASLVLGVGFMLAAAAPYLGITTGFAGVSTFPDDLESKKAFIALSENFAGGQTAPAEIVIDGDADSPEVQSGVQRLTGALASDPAFQGQAIVQVNDEGDLTLVQAVLKGDPQTVEATETIRHLRADVIPEAFAGANAVVLVGGDSAFNTDFFDQAGMYQPIVFVFVLGLSFLLLTVVFRSIVVPIKAIIMNLLSVGAAYGLITLVFQEGGPAIGKSIADFLGFQRVEAIEAWIPLFLFSILFGLSMDYHVFLLTRIRERFDQTGNNAESVAYGLRTTAGIITGAALIMVAVFAGFAAGRLVPLQQMGFGLAVAVFLDATIVRSVLVPASMKLLGNANWYLPKWLQWLPDIKVEGHETVAVPELERVP
ncbi:MAG: MMPL family transporter [Actinomycetota bacterium]